MFSSFFRGLVYMQSGFSLTRKPGLRRYILIPLAINTLVFIGLTWWTTTLFDELINSMSWLNADPESWTGWLVEKFRIILWAIFTVFALVVFAYTFSLVANFIAAPFNSLLAERCETYLTQGKIRADDESLANTLKRLPIVMTSELAKIIYLIKWIIPVLILYIIPGVNFIAPFVSLAFGAWMFTLEYVDYPMGNRGYLFKQIRVALRTNRPLALGYGSAITVLMAIPVVNLFVMPAAVCGATKLWLDEISNNSQHRDAL